jgi:hypothetical protein
MFTAVDAGRRIKDLAFAAPRRNPPMKNMGVDPNLKVVRSEVHPHSR